MGWCEVGCGGLKFQFGCCLVLVGVLGKAIAVGRARLAPSEIDLFRELRLDDMEFSFVCWVLFRGGHVAGQRNGQGQVGPCETGPLRDGSSLVKCFLTLGVVIFLSRAWGSPLTRAGPGRRHLIQICSGQAESGSH